MIQFPELDTLRLSLAELNDARKSNQNITDTQLAKVLNIFQKTFAEAADGWEKEKILWEKDKKNPSPQSSLDHLQGRIWECRGNASRLAELLKKVGMLDSPATKVEVEPDVVEIDLE